MNKPEAKKKYCVISHTHWDREWYLPFEQFRLRLIDLIDRLLDIVEAEPDYIFHLDAQTVVLEDYLEIRRYNEKRLRSAIENGQIVIGPWYVQNDFFLTSGESTIRNLLEGIRIAKDFGACSRVGYAPDQFGNISQLPQILNGFNIDSFIFGRGFMLSSFNGSSAPATEFRWLGPDGSAVLGIFMKDWYNNTQRFSEDIEKAMLLLQRAGDSLSADGVTPYFLFMNGVDHLEAQDNLLPILSKIQDNLGTDAKIEQTTLDKYIADVKGYINKNNIKLYEHTGELRMGHDGSVLNGTLSSRPYLKISNTVLQNRLEQQIEPLYSLLEMSGCNGIYSKDHLRYFWKKLIQNHPHDSICGCSRDEVHNHMENRFAELDEATTDWLQRGMNELVYRSPLRRQDGNDYLVTVFNPLDSIQSGVVTARFQFLQTDNVKGFRIENESGENVPCYIAEKGIMGRHFLSPINLPMGGQVDVYTVYFYVENLGGMETKTYRVIADSELPAVSHLPVKKNILIENEYVSLELFENGTINFKDKKSRRVIKNCIGWEESVDRGCSYVYIESDDKQYRNTDFPAVVELIENNEFKQRSKITWNAIFPKEYDFYEQKRSKETKVTEISFEFILEKGNPNLEIKYCIDNHTTNHRIRLVIDSGLKNTTVFGDSPFDIIDRSKSKGDILQNKLHPNTSFVCIQDKFGGLAVLTEGQSDYEPLENGKTALTLCRSTGAISQWREAVDKPFTPVYNPYWTIPGNQLIRKIEGRLGITSYTGDLYDADIPNRALKFRNGLLNIFVPENRKKWTGGRPAVQDSAIEELFFYPEKYSGVTVSGLDNIIKIHGKHIVRSAFKKADNGEGFILRLYHYGETDETVKIETNHTVYRTNLEEVNDELLNSELSLISKPKELITLRII